MTNQTDEATTQQINLIKNDDRGQKRGGISAAKKQLLTRENDTTKKYPPIAEE
jgi:hypothetical protein